MPMENGPAVLEKAERKPEQIEQTDRLKEAGFLDAVLHRIPEHTASGKHGLVTSGPDVYTVQCALAKAGGNLKPDGHLKWDSPEYQAAVRNFQHTYGLTEDGLAGHDTVTKLGEVLKDPSKQKPMEKAPAKVAETHGQPSENAGENGIETMSKEEVLREAGRIANHSMSLNRIG
jgi:peptidoglycan hydrolase-like protein with peptidoglycan-binding domain